jgi:hypothetical protein
MDGAASPWAASCKGGPSERVGAIRVELMRAAPDLSATATEEGGDP